MTSGSGGEQSGLGGIMHRRRVKASKRSGRGEHTERIMRLTERRSGSRRMIVVQGKIEINEPSRGGRGRKERRIIRIRDRKWHRMTGASGARNGLRKRQRKWIDRRMSGGRVS